MAFMQEMLNLVKVFLNGSFFLNTEVTDAVATVGLFTGFFTLIFSFFSSSTVFFKTSAGTTFTLEILNKA